MTVMQLARDCGVSRSTVLYYESLGLLKPSGRSNGNYRLYRPADAARLRQIRAYRNMGVALEDIREILDRGRSDAASVLRRRLADIDAEIERLRGHQRAIVRLLDSTISSSREKMITKDKWVSIMKATGFTEDDMRRWHAEFEKSSPKEHQEFLEFLHIPEEEIRGIRAWSRGESK